MDFVPFPCTLRVVISVPLLSLKHTSGIPGQAAHLHPHPTSAFASLWQSFPTSSHKAASWNCTSTFLQEPWTWETASTVLRVCTTIWSRGHCWATASETARWNSQGMAACRGKHSMYLLHLPLRLGGLPYVKCEGQAVHSVIKRAAPVKLETSLSKKLAGMLLSVWNDSARPSRWLHFLLFSFLILLLVLLTQLVLLSSSKWTFTGSPWMLGLEGTSKGHWV